MLRDVRRVSKGLLKDLGDDTYFKLENIVNAVEAYSSIDRVIYVGFNVSSSNPIWGQFLKFGQVPSAYTTFETTVEVRYANHLSKEWRRFVVSKELCHALDTDEGAHSVTDRAIDRIISRFSLLSASKEITSSTKAFDAEALAEIGALDLLCPLENRRALMGTADPIDLCARFGIPDDYSAIAFDRDYIDVIDDMMHSE